MNLASMRLRVDDDATGRAAFAAALLEPAHPGPAGLRTWNGSDPQARLAVYRNNVVSSLVDALADTFPVVQLLVGEAFFRAMAATFVRRSPPRSCVLATYGEHLPDFIDTFEPARSLPYLADMARLEFARVRAWHAADAPVAAAEALAQALGWGDRLAEVRLKLHPAVSLVASRHAVVSLWAAHQGDAAQIEAMPAIDVDRPETALVLRTGLDVLVLPMPPGAAAFVQAAGVGVGLGEAAARGMKYDAAFDLAATLSMLITHGALSALQVPAGDTA